MLKRMMEDLDALDDKLSAVSVGEKKIVYLHEFSEESSPVAASAEKSIAPASDTAPAVTLKPGDLPYAIMDVGVNSDVPSAVLATVTSRGTIQLEAYAVDPSTSEASVASSVNPHFFSRWSGLIASAFLEMRALPIWSVATGKNRNCLAVLPSSKPGS